MEKPLIIMSVLALGIGSIFDSLAIRELRAEAEKLQTRVITLEAIQVLYTPVK